MSRARDCTATRVAVVTDREHEWRLRMQMVQRAERFLLLTTYYFGSDERSGQMADALLAAARRGVRVALVLDSFGQRLAQNLSAPSTAPRLLQRLRDLEAAGGRVVRYAPDSLRHRLVGGGLHVKIQVSEAGVALFGSSNVAYESFSRWHEVALQVEGEIAAHLVREACRFAAMSEDETAALAGCLPAPLDGARIRGLRYVREDPAERCGRFFPLGVVHNRLTDAIVQLIDSARHSLCIASLYCKPAPVLKAAILRACARGVAVEIFHSHRDSLGVSQVPWMSASIQYASILKAGVRIYENRAGEHSKMLLVDNRRVAIGSYNLEHAAHDRLVEAMIFSDDGELGERFRALFQTLRQSPANTLLTSGWLRELPLQLQIKRWLSRPLQRWL